LFNILIIHRKFLKRTPGTVLTSESRRRGLGWVQRDRRHRRLGIHGVRRKGEHRPMSQLPPGHWESKEQTAGLGGKGEQAPKRQLPPGHWESNEQSAGFGGKGEQVPKRQLPPGHSESKLHEAGPVGALFDRAWLPTAQPQRAISITPNKICLISAPFPILTPRPARRLGGCARQAGSQGSRWEAGSRWKPVPDISGLRVYSVRTVSASRPERSPPLARFHDKVLRRLSLSPNSTLGPKRLSVRVDW
jgi:hypothetical protein